MHYLIYINIFTFQKLKYMLMFESGESKVYFVKFRNHSLVCLISLRSACTFYVKIRKQRRSHKEKKKTKNKTKNYCPGVNKYTHIYKLVVLTSDKSKTIQRRLTWPLRKDDTYKSRNIHMLVKNQDRATSVIYNFILKII